MLKFATGQLTQEELSAIGRGGSLRAGNETITAIDCLDISEICNNKGFADLDSTDPALSFDGVGYSFFTGDLPASETWEIAGMKFHFPKPRADRFDNISCNGQEIPITPGVYSAIMLLGTAGFGSFSEYIKLKFAGGGEAKITVEFTDWWLPSSNFGETVAWSGRSCKIGPKGVEVSKHKVFLYAESQPVPGTSPLVGIQLPDCPNLRIFAISLGKTAAED